jgi:hypothetical protein
MLKELEQMSLKVTTIDLTVSDCNSAVFSTRSLIDSLRKSVVLFETKLIEVVQSNARLQENKLDASVFYGTIPAMEAKFE